jgi:hypothetical protein
VPVSHRNAKTTEMIFMGGGETCPMLPGGVQKNPRVTAGQPVLGIHFAGAAAVKNIEKQFTNNMTIDIRFVQILFIT